jgi:hypothetical protein
MPLGVFFEAVDTIPVDPQAGAIYFQKRPDGELDVAVPDVDGVPVWLRRPHLQMAFRSTGSHLPANDEFGRYLTVEDLELDALLSGAISSTPADEDAIITVSRGVDLVARFTFPAGQSQAIPEIIIPTVPKDNLLIFRSPVTQDATLSGVTGTLGARRI